MIGGRACDDRAADISHTLLNPLEYLSSQSCSRNYTCEDDIWETVVFDF